MIALELIQTFIKYHLDMTRLVWDSIDQITEEQFVSEDAYSRGSIRNLMVPLANTDSNRLAGLKNIPEDQDAPKKKYEDYPDRARRMITEGRMTPADRTGFVNTIMIKLLTSAFLEEP